MNSYVADPNSFSSKTSHNKPIRLGLEEVDDDVFRSNPQKSSHKKTMHKGFVLGHAIQAVNGYIGDDRSVSSIHGVFVGSVSHNKPIVYYLESLQNDQNKCVASNVEGRQNGRIVFSGIASLSKIKDGSIEPAARRSMSSIPTPQSLQNIQDAYKQSNSKSQTHMPKEFEKVLERLTILWTENNVEFRLINQHCWFKSGNTNKELMRFWIKCKSSFDTNSKQAVLGFLSGLCTEVMPDKRIMSQQTLWFNQVNFKPNEWIYCEVSSLQQRKQFADFRMCKFWNTNGDLLASAVQGVSLKSRSRL